jgi:hypothetical protein
MFDIARAALLRAGVAEDKLPRTHNGDHEELSPSPDNDMDE